MIPFILKYVTPRDYVIGGFGICIIYMATMWHGASVELKKAKLVYENPQVKTVEKIVYRQGPVRIVTKIKEIPGGGKETTIEEDRSATTNEVVSNSESAPVPISVALAEPRTDRYLLSVGMNRLTPDFDGKALFVGYGFKNRLDLQVGGIQHDGFSPWVLATLRF